MSKKTTVTIYWDPSDPQNLGWAYNVTREEADGWSEDTGPLYARRDSKLPSLLRKLKAEEPQLCETWPRAGDFRPLEHDGPGWEARGGA